MSEVTSALSDTLVPVAEKSTVEDLSAEIIRSIARTPGDRVTCTHVYNDNYRCNWWGPQSTVSYDNPGMMGLTVTTHRVRKSMFLKVTKADGVLKIVEPSASVSSVG